VVKRFVGGFVAAAALATLAAPVGAQSFSDSYTFLKAVRDRNGEKVMSVLSEPGTIAINAKDPSTGDTALHILVKGRDENWLGFILSKGARPDGQNREGMTPLAIAAQIGWVEGAQALLASRANVDIPNSRGQTPLILAVQNRDVVMTRLLLSKGANPNRNDLSGYSALDYAKRDPRAGVILKTLQTAPAIKTMGPTR
jgi:ankyrin repeat protein